MVFCEHCGVANEDGALFCAACGGTLQVFRSDAQEIDMIKSQTVRVSPLQTGFKGFSPKQKTEVQQYAVLVVGMVIIISALAFVLPNSITLVFPLGFIVMGLVIDFLVARQSSRDPLLFVAIAIGLLTLGLALLFDDFGSVDLILPIGLMAGGLVLDLMFARNSSRDPALFIAIAIGILTVGLGMLFSDFDSMNLIFSAGFFAFGLLVIVWSLKRILRVPSPPDHGFNFRG